MRTLMQGYNSANISPKSFPLASATPASTLARGLDGRTLATGGCVRRWGLITGSGAPEENFGFLNAFLRKKHAPNRRTAPRSKALVETCTIPGTCKPSPKNPIPKKLRSVVRFAFHQIVLANSIQNLPFISKLTEPFFRISKNHFRTRKLH